MNLKLSSATTIGLMILSLSPNDIIYHLQAFTIVGNTNPAKRDIISSSYHRHDYYYYSESTTRIKLHSTSSPQNQSSKSDNSNASNTEKQSIKQKVKNLAKSIMIKPLGTTVTAAVQPKAIASILTDATISAVDLAVEEAKSASTTYFKSSRSTTVNLSKLLEEEAKIQGNAALALDEIALAKTAIVDAYNIAEASIIQAESSIQKCKLALELCKKEASTAIANAERAAMEACKASERATELAAGAAFQVARGTEVRNDSSNVAQEGGKTNLVNTVDVSSSTAATTTTTAAGVDASTVTSNSSRKVVDLAQDSVDLSSISYEEVGYHLSEMAPPFINEDQCLVPGEPIVRVEKAPDNSRRIFAGVDIMASVDDVWNVLTDYNNLQKVVPNLVVNDVLELYDATYELPFQYEIDPTTRSEEQCRALSTRMKGAKMKQVGGAKVVGINFSARTTLEVREWPMGLPDFFHYFDDIYEGESRDQRARKEKGQKLERYHFPRPFAISTLPTKDISMQSIENDDGEFRLYQGVWRMQPLPGCAPQGGSAMRLTYAVEISPRPYLPVGLVEGRISQDLCNNLKAIRDYVTVKAPTKKVAVKI